jgi:sulfur-carrier protein
VTSAASHPPDADTPRPAGQPAGVVVRYWAAARAAAGCSEETVDASTLADVLARVRDLHADQPEFARVLEHSSLLVGERPVGARDPAQVRLGPGDVIDVLPPFAGGSSARQQRLNRLGVRSVRGVWE